MKMIWISSLAVMVALAVGGCDNAKKADDNAGKNQAGKDTPTTASRTGGDGVEPNAPVDKTGAPGSAGTATKTESVARVDSSGKVLPSKTPLKDMVEVLESIETSLAGAGGDCSAMTAKVTAAQQANQMKMESAKLAMEAFGKKAAKDGGAAAMQMLSDPNFMKLQTMGMGLATKMATLAAKCASNADFQKMQKALSATMSGLKPGR